MRMIRTPGFERVTVRAAPLGTFLGQQSNGYASKAHKDYSELTGPQPLHILEQT
eukprot:gene23742-9921_t